ncbi:MAG: hypothetical protein ABJ242_07855 [Marinomonas sp.]
MPASNSIFKDHPILSILICFVVFGGLIWIGLSRLTDIDEVPPKLVPASISNIALFPSNSGTSYNVIVKLADGQMATLTADLDMAKDCKIGQEIMVERRGLNHKWTDNGCRIEN